jgi:hypothetical protein
VTSIDDRIAEQRRMVAETQARLDELSEQLAAHELWLRIADPDLVSEHAEEIQEASDALAGLGEAHDELFRLRIGLDTLDSGTTDPDVVERPADDQRIGVLLPLRLETRFRFLRTDQSLDEPDSEPDDEFAEWRLLVRIEPDAMAFSAAPSEIVRIEAEAVAAAWNRCGRSLAGDPGAEAFDLLAGQVGGPARASYLLRSVPVFDDGGELVPAQEYAEERGERPPPLLGLPESLHLWVEDVTGLHHMEELRPDRVAIAAQARPDAMVDPANPGDPARTWWTSFAVARDVGLAVEVPLGHEKPRFSAVYCVGAALAEDGSVTPRQLFGSHASAGRLGTLAPLTPTNTVAGEPTTDTGRDPGPWLEVARSAPDDVAGLARTLTGERLLPGVPRPDRTLAEAATTLVTALWPAVWQRSLKDVYGAGLAAFHTGDWATRHLHPFGVHPVLRVGDLPYGVLPISNFNRWVWRSDDGPEGLSDPRVEQKLEQAAANAIGPLSATGEATGSTAGADADRMLEVLSRTPVSREYGSRSTGPSALVASMLAALGAEAMQFGTASFLQHWKRQADRFLSVTDGNVLRRYSPVGAVRRWPDPADLAPDHRDALKLYFNSTWIELAENDDLSERWRTEVRDPDAGRVRLLSPPVFARLVRHALVLTQAEVTRAFVGDPVANVLPVHDPFRMMRDAFGSDWEAQVPDLPDVVVEKVRQANPDARLVAAVRQFEDVRDAVRMIMDSETDPMLAALPAVLDTTGHRVDAWYAGLASRRLAEQTRAGVPFVLGAYGWVDDLRPSEDRTPPTRAGLLHAPGYSQALSAAVLRDHVVHQPDDPRWRVGLHSAQIRLAANIAEQVRAGVHISEALGREIERRVGAPGDVDQLRALFPARPEWAGRRVCDGLQVLAATRPVDPDPALSLLVPGWLVPDHGEQLEDLRQVVDTYADLLLTDAVHDVVDGRPRAAAESLEAAAGLGAPPELRVLRTQREGGTVRTTVRAVLPWPAAPDALAAGGSSPAGVADPAVAQLLTTELGNPATWTWTRGGSNTDLSRLGLQVADVLVAPPAALAALVEKALEGPATGGTAAGNLAQAARLVAALGGQIITDGQRDQLLERLSRLRVLVDQVIARPEAAGGLGDSAALAWGLVDGSGYRTALQKRLSEAGPSGTDAGSATEELTRRIRTLLPPALGLPLVCREPLPSHEVAPELDTDWLPVVAAVRPAVAALEVAQLSARLPWAGATSDNLPIWSSPGLSPHGFPQERVVTVYYGPAIGATPSGSQVGVVTVDAWAETVPSPRHTTWTAFGYDGPRARAPQAVLVVVPPDPSQPIDDETLLGALQHARLQARARAAPTASSEELFIGLPTAALLATGPAGCDVLRSS